MRIMGMMGIMVGQVGPLTAPKGEMFLEVLKCLLILVAMAGLVLGVAVAIRTLRKRRERETVTAAPRPRAARVAEAVCEKRHEALEEQLEALEDEDRRLQGEIALLKAGMAEMEHRIDAGMGEMERRLDKKDEDRAIELHNRLNKMPAEIVAGLVNSRALWQQNGQQNGGNH